MKAPKWIRKINKNRNTKAERRRWRWVERCQREQDRDFEVVLGRISSLEPEVSRALLEILERP